MLLAMSYRNLKISCAHFYNRNSLSRIRIVLTLFFYEKRNICSQVLFLDFFQRFKIFRKNADRVENENFARDDNILTFI